MSFSNFNEKLANFAQNLKKRLHFSFTFCAKCLPLINEFIGLPGGDLEASEFIKNSDGKSMETWKILKKIMRDF